MSEVDKTPDDGESFWSEHKPALMTSAGLFAGFVTLAMRNLYQERASRQPADEQPPEIPPGPTEPQ